jgi:hypothetical protein
VGDGWTWVGLAGMMVRLAAGAPQPTANIKVKIIHAPCQKTFFRSIISPFIASTFDSLLHDS